jgi:hypothetical protein
MQQRALEIYPSIFFRIRLAAALFAHCIHTYGGERRLTQILLIQCAQPVSDTMSERRRDFESSQLILPLLSQAFEKLRFHEDR